MTERPNVVDLFTGEVRPAPEKAREKRVKAYAAQPGTGPAGESCGTCNFLRYRQGNRRVYYKCGLCSGSHSMATDIRVRSPACQRWEPKPPPAAA